eukprot:scaffold167404_cov18-Tisochrysis_lutea.AAC.2
MEELVRKVVDLVDNRVEMNLRAIANTLLVDLPGDRSFSYDDFIASQNKYQVRSCRCCAAFMLASIQNGRSSLVTHHWRSPFVSSKVVWSCCILLSVCVAAAPMLAELQAEMGLCWRALFKEGAW